VPFGQLFRFSDSLDQFLMLFGTIGAVAQGAIMPGFSFIFGALIDTFNKPGINFLDEVTKIALDFLWIGIAALFVAFAQSACWNVSAHRQIKRVREHYVRAILRQEIGWFDQNATGELTSRIAGDTVVIQEAIGDKLATFLQFSATCIFGFTLGFVKGWKLALVMLAVTPLLAVCGGLMMKTMASLAQRGQAAYAKAGAFATEALAGARTIASFAAEETVTAKYTSRLQE